MDPGDANVGVANDAIASDAQGYGGLSGDGQVGGASADDRDLADRARLRRRDRQAACAGMVFGARDRRLDRCAATRCAPEPLSRTICIPPTRSP